MKKLLIVTGVIATLALVSTAVFAYGRGWQGGGCDGSGKGPMMRALDLTDEQQKQIFALRQDFRQKMFDSRNDPSKFREIRDEHRKAVEAVLTDEQKKKFSELREKNREGSGRCGRGRW